jgi:hypothetical protein
VKRSLKLPHFLKPKIIHPESTLNDSMRPHMTKNPAASFSITQGLKLTWIASAFYLKMGLTSMLLLVGLCAKEAPNFILVLTDDQGWTSLSAAMDLRRPSSKSDYHKTPNMDALLERGMRFSNGYAGGTSLLTNPIQYTIWKITRTAKFHKSLGAKWS